MKYELEIDCGNAAFQNHPSEEIARILRKLVADMEDGKFDATNEISLWDINGNIVGRCSLQ